MKPPTTLPFRLSTPITRPGKVTHPPIIVPASELLRNPQAVQPPSDSITEEQLLRIRINRNRAIAIRRKKAFIARTTAASAEKENIPMPALPHNQKQVLPVPAKLKSDSPQTNRMVLSENENIPHAKECTMSEEEESVLQSPLPAQQQNTAPHPRQLLPASDEEVDDFSHYFALDEKASNEKRRRRLMSGAK